MAEALQHTCTPPANYYGNRRLPRLSRADYRCRTNFELARARVTYNAAVPYIGIADFHSIRERDARLYTPRARFSRCTYEIGSLARKVRTRGIIYTRVIDIYSISRARQLMNRGFVKLYSCVSEPPRVRLALSAEL